MKRKATALSLCLATALLLGLSQCKKQEAPITPTTEPVEVEEEGIRITLDIENGGKHEVVPGDVGAVNYTFGDKIYVGDGEKYIGTLTCTGSRFEGIILSPSTTTLHFYFVGGLGTGTLTPGTSTFFTVDISDQSSNLPVLSYGSAPYAANATSYTCMLKNKCALVKFGLNYNTSNVVKLNNNTDIKTNAIINFGLPENTSLPITAGEASNDINLYSQDGKTKWAILLKNDNEVGTTIEIGTEAYSKFYNVTVPILGNNSYETIGNINNHPEFSVSVDNSNETETIKKVMFSKGNLQYQSSSSSWRFAEHQWDYVGDNANNNLMSETSEEWIDLFGWGTWTGNSPKPLEISGDVTYVWDNDDFTGTLDGHNGWRTLSSNEWNYLLTERHSNKVNDVSDARFAKAMVNNIAGLIVFSDNYSQPLEVTYPANINVADALYMGNNYSADEWDILADYGAIFLPAAGNRTVTTTTTTTEGDSPTTITTTTINVNDAGSKGYYWIPTSNDSHKYIEFNNTNISIETENTRDYPTFGRSVRLVRDIE